MPSISSNSLFHFTSKDSLLKILESSFRPSYSRETLYFNDSEIRVLVPMICFCDIPLSQINNHIATYGEYGIGMSKEWGKKI